MPRTCRREFLYTGLGALGAGVGFMACQGDGHSPSRPDTPPPTPQPAQPIVAISYTPDYASALTGLRSALNLIGGISQLVSGKRVAIKVNVTGWGQQLLGMPATETYVVHGDVLTALISVLREAGARGVRVLESVPVRDDLASFTQSIGWDTGTMARLGAVEFINTRNGRDEQYTTLAVPNGRLFDSLLVHPAYYECDVLISLAKMKNHRTAGVTLTLKNMFGITPNAVYGDDAPSEHAIGLRFRIHDRRDSRSDMLPAEKQDLADQPAEVRIPRVIGDVCSARTIDLAIIDGVCTISGGEGPWHESTGELYAVRPSVLIVGRDPVATDAVGVGVMGYQDPLATTLPPFTFCENHIRIAHDAGLGVGDLSRIDVRGMSIAAARTPFAWL